MGERYHKILEDLSDQQVVVIIAAAKIHNSEMTKTAHKHKFSIGLGWKCPIKAIQKCQNRKGNLPMPSNFLLTTDWNYIY